MSTETAVYRSTRAVWYFFGAVETLLAVRFVLRVFAANPSAPFTQFVYETSQIFLAPFRFVFGAPSVGGSAFELSTLLAMAVYWLFAWGVVKLLLMNRSVTQYEARVELQEQDMA